MKIDSVKTFTADDGERLSLRVVGNGPPLLLLHGWTSSHSTWSALVDSLSSDYLILCPDARGHGKHTFHSTQTPDVTRLARDVLNLIDHFELGQVAVVGHSMGALTLWQFIRDHGCQRLSKICIIDQSPKLVTDAGWPHGIYGDFDLNRSQKLIDELGQEFAESVLKLGALGLNSRARKAYERNSPGWQQLRQYLSGLEPQPLITIWKSLVAADYRDVLPLIKVPTLLVWGGESNFYTQATARYLQDNITGAVLSCFEGTDHSPQLQTPERFASELGHFLAHSITR